MTGRASVAVAAVSAPLAAASVVPAARRTPRARSAWPRGQGSRVARRTSTRQDLPATEGPAVGRAPVTVVRVSPATRPTARGGTAGVASAGAVSGGLWVPAGGSGGNGSVGSDGSGGGGGGGGGGCDDNIDDWGAGGGGGGAGGAKAPAAGSGGTTGRASIGVLIGASSSPTLVNVSVTLGTGGAGGAGGAGGVGQPGGTGGTGGARYQGGGRGGNGGAGGAGGASGGGGGGAGGPAIGVLVTGGSTPTLGVTYGGGSGGPGGSAGSTGVPGAAGATGPAVNLVTL